MTVHQQVRLRDPFTGHRVGIDRDLAPVIKTLWSLGIETTSSCQGPPLYDRAIICFAEPVAFYDSPGYWEPDDDDPAESERWDEAAAAWDASRLSGAQQLWDLLIGGGAPANVFRWDWQFREGPGSAVAFPAADIPVLERLLTCAAVTETVSVT